MRKFEGHSSPLLPSPQPLPPSHLYPAPPQPHTYHLQTHSTSQICTYFQTRTKDSSLTQCQPPLVSSAPFAHAGACRVNLQQEVL